MSRTNLKQQLMKQQLLQQELREKQSHNEHQMSQSLQSSRGQALQPQHTSVQSLNLQQFPSLMSSHQLLQKVQHNQQMRQTLENPTNYHMLQTQQKQSVSPHSHSPLHPLHSHSVPNVPTQLSPGCHPNQEQVHQNTGHSLSSTALGPNGPQSPFALSPDSPLSAPPSSACSTSELDDVFDVLGGFDNSNVSQIVDEEELCGAIAATLPSDINYYLEQQPTTPTHDSASSCPQLTEQEMKAWQKDRQKKDNHNQIERRRRYNINDRIKELGTLLPKGGEDTKHFDLVKDMKQNKGTILKASVDYVRLLKRENMRLNEQDRRYREMENNYKTLQMQMQELQLQMRSSPQQQQQQQNLQQQPHQQQPQQHQQNPTSNQWNQMVNSGLHSNSMDTSMDKMSKSDPFIQIPNSLGLTSGLSDADTLAATQSLQRIIKQEFATPASPMSPSQASSGLGSSLPSVSPAQHYFHFNELGHDPILSAAALNIKNEAYSPQSMDICH